MIAVVDYGAGNLHSVCNALDLFGTTYRVMRSPEGLSVANKILLPGVGHFGQMMRSLEGSGIASELRRQAATGKPLFGICLGMQALYESSEEAPGVQGLGLLAGEIRRFVDVPRIPHMGWNDVRISSQEPPLPTRSSGAQPIAAGGGGTYYFANSYYAPISEATVGVCHYGVDFAAIVESGNVGGVQFHPEKSGEAGLDLLRRWCEAC